MTERAAVRVVLCEANPVWPERFRLVAADVRGVFGGRARRIDHIGSTAVPGLAAKDIIDVQVSVDDPAALDDSADPVRVGLAGLGFVFVADNDDRRKRFFQRRPDGTPASDATAEVNLHVRRDGCVSQQQALLFRDYLRDNAGAKALYEQEKRRLSSRRWRSVDHYADAKGDVVWTLLRDADRWSWSGWRPGASDA